MNKYLLIPTLLIITIVSAGCSGGKKQDRTETLAAEELYADAKHAMELENFERASKYFKRLNARYPFSRYAEQAQLELSYSYYKDQESERALSAADRFIKTYPRHANVDYAYYIRGLINFDRISGFLDQIVPVNHAQRDQQFATQAFLAFGELLVKFPDSRFGPDARKRMVFLRNRLAEHEISIARYYVRKHAYVAAANRSKYVLEKYPESTALGDALAIMALSYNQLELPELADDAVRVLQLNYPDHPYLTGKTMDDRGFFRKLWVFGSASDDHG